MHSLQPRCWWHPCNLAPKREQVVSRHDPAAAPGRMHFSGHYLEIAVGAVKLLKPGGQAAFFKAACSTAALWVFRELNLYDPYITPNTTAVPLMIGTRDLDVAYGMARSGQVASRPALLASTRHDGAGLRALKATIHRTLQEAFDWYAPLCQA